MVNACRFPNKGRVKTASEKASKSFKDYTENKLPQECRAIEMKQLLEKFQELLIEEGLTPEDAVNYRAEKLKDRLVLHYGSSLTFHRQRAFNNSELVYS